MDAPSEGPGADRAGAQQLRLVYATARALAESATLVEAAPRMLEAICRALGWEHGGLWRVDPAAGVLRSVATWHLPSLRFDEFVAASRQTAFSPGIGLPGRVWAARQPAWIPDVVHDSNFHGLREPVPVRGWLVPVARVGGRARQGHGLDLCGRARRQRSQARRRGTETLRAGDGRRKARAGGERGPARPARQGTRGRETAGRRSDGRQGRVPRQHEPRDSDADERDHRHDRAGAPHEAECRAARLPAHGERVERGAAGARERHPRFLEDRSAQTVARPAAVRVPRHRRGCCTAAGPARPRKRTRARLSHSAGRATRARRRPRAAEAGHRQPGGERHQVHRARRGDRRRRARSAGRRRGRVEVHGVGHGHRDSCRAAVAGLRPLRAGGRLHDPPIRRLGAGLAISAQLVELMGGRIWIESDAGRGSTFHFVARFEMQRGTPEPPPPLDAANLRDLRVLVVDDSATNRRILVEVLRSWHMKPTSADGAPAALTLLRTACDAGEPFGLVLTDALMPGFDGFMLARAIKEDARLSDVRLILLTSAGLPEGRVRARQAGFAAYLSKPVKQADLLDAILTAFGSPAKGVRRPARRARRSPRARTRSLRVLVAEDNPTNQKLVVALLEQRGHTVVVVSDGRQALARAAERPFDVILMDVQMPEMSGLEATTAIRERAAGTHVPIVAMTAHVMTGDRERCLDAGMDAYVSKPLRPDELFAAIETVRPASAERGGVSPEPGAGGRGLPTLDGPALLAGFGGNRTLLREVIDVFLADTPSVLDATRQAAVRRDSTALAASAHKLKGSIGLFVRAGAYEAARRLEHAARTGELAGVEQTVAELDTEIARLCEALRDLRKTLRRSRQAF